MSESVRSMLLGPSGLYVIAAIALIPTVSRRVRKLDTALYDRFIHLFLVGISCQCLHFVEEFVTGFHHRFPVLLGLAPWSSEFFVTLNLAWIALWVVSPIGLRQNFQPAFFPVWFLTFAMIANGIAHPIMAIASGGYFPGLVTSPVLGILGVVLTRRLFQLTK